MALPSIGLIWQLARRIEDVFEKVDNATRGLSKLRDDLVELERRVALRIGVLEAGQAHQKRLE